MVLALVSAGIAAGTVRGTSLDDTTELAGAQSGALTGTGSLSVSGVSYDFQADHCLITDTDFFATGSGSLDGKQFRIAASISSIELSFGVLDDRQEPAVGNFWLRSQSPPSWSQDQNGVTATVGLIDPLDPESTIYSGEFTAECDSSPSEIQSPAS